MLYNEFMVFEDLQKKLDQLKANIVRLDDCL